MNAIAPAPPAQPGMACPSAPLGPDAFREPIYTATRRPRALRPGLISVGLSGRRPEARLRRAIDPRGFNGMH
jgi:hypothetical protein